MADGDRPDNEQSVTNQEKTASNPTVLSMTLEAGRIMALDDDDVLVARFVGGDQASFDLLYRKYYDKVYSIAKGILLDADEAADAVQEVFTLVYRHLPRFDRRARFSTWLFRIAVNRSIQESRKRKHRIRNVELTEAVDTKAPEPAEPADPRIQAALAQLKPDDRALILLFYWEELSLQEISELVGCNVNAAKTRLYRAREKFRSLYEGAE